MNPKIGKYAYSCEQYPKINFDYYKLETWFYQIIWFNALDFFAFFYDTKRRDE